MQLPIEFPVIVKTNSKLVITTIFTYFCVKRRMTFMTRDSKLFTEYFLRLFNEIEVNKKNWKK